jgi:hypothetical protein
MKCRLLYLLLLTTVGTANAASTMAVSEIQESRQTPPDQSQIVFARLDKGWGSATVFDVTNGEPELIGILSGRDRVVHFVEPGNHTFMVISEAADFMGADLAAGKKYYAVADIRMGIWKGRFSLHPVRNGSEGKFQVDTGTFKKWLPKTEIVENTEASIEWAKANHESIVGKQEKYWKKWEAKSDDAIAERTLNESDGI